MLASVARKRSDNRNGVNLVRQTEELMQSLLKNISVESDKGETSIPFPYYVSGVEFVALKAAFVKLGYTVTYHDDPDPGSPHSYGSSHTIDW